MDALANIFQLLTMVATAVMAASAAIQARRFQLDLFGATVLGVVTAVGGGTIRDVLIGRMPVFWIEDTTFLLVAVPVAILSYLVARAMPAGNGQRLRLLMYLDAIGLGLFTLTGVQVGLAAGISPVIAIVIGCVTGTAGGMIRDLLCNITPSVLREDLYATLSLAGGGLYLMLIEWVADPMATLCAFALIFVARIGLLLQYPPEDRPPEDRDESGR